MRNRKVMWVIYVFETMPLWQNVFVKIKTNGWKWKLVWICILVENFMKIASEIILIHRVLRNELRFLPHSYISTDSAVGCFSDNDHNDCIDVLWLHNNMSCTSSFVSELFTLPFTYALSSFFKNHFNYIF